MFQKHVEACKVPSVNIKISATEMCSEKLHDIIDIHVHVCVFFFQTKTIAGLFTKEKWFLALSLVNIVAAIGLTLYRLIYVVINDSNSTDFTFTLLIILNASKY